LIKRLAVLALCGVFLCGLAFAQTVAVAAAREYLRYTRDVAISQPDKQNYLVIDAAIWAISRTYDFMIKMPRFLTRSAKN
jgi:hypothetical protein